MRMYECKPELIRCRMHLPSPSVKGVVFPKLALAQHDALVSAGKTSSD